MSKLGQLRTCLSLMTTRHNWISFKFSSFILKYSLASCQSKTHIQNSFFATTGTAVLHHHMSLTCCIESHHTPVTLAPAHAPCLFPIDLHTGRQHLEIVHFLLLFLLSETLFKMMSGVPHHCHHLSLV